MTNRFHLKSSLLFVATLFSSVVSLTAQTLPEGGGRDILSQKCSRCHTQDVVATYRHNAQDWQDVVLAMNDQGANVVG
jgi:cytochrome c5